MSFVPSRSSAIAAATVSDRKPFETFYAGEVSDLLTHAAV